MAFQRNNMRANGSGKNSLDEDLTLNPPVPIGGNLWVYRPTNGDDLAAVRTANYFLPFQEGLSVGDVILLVTSSIIIGISNVSVSNKTTLTLTTLVVTV